MHDDRVFVDPEEFRPNRFSSLLLRSSMSSSDELSASEASKDKLDADVDPASLSAHDPSDVVFGFGRRICPGRHFAVDVLWLTIANMLSVFDILPPIDSLSGKEVLPNIEFKSGFIVQPKLFDCRVVPRSAQHLKMLRALV